MKNTKLSKHSKQGSSAIKIKKVQMTKTKNTSALSKIIKKAYAFKFDNVFGSTIQNDEIFNTMVNPILSKVLNEGLSGTVFMYG